MIEMKVRQMLEEKYNEFKGNPENFRKRIKEESPGDFPFILTDLFIRSLLAPVSEQVKEFYYLSANEFLESELKKIFSSLPEPLRKDIELKVKEFLEGRR